MRTALDLIRPLNTYMEFASMSNRISHTKRLLARPVAPQNHIHGPVRVVSRCDQQLPNSRPIRMLRLPQVIDATGLGKTKIYELQAEGSFPMRIKITAHSVAWIEADVQAWLAARIQTSTGLSST